VGLELDISYQNLAGSIDRKEAAVPKEIDAEGQGFSIVPTGVLLGKF
jgi:hypothetical protein